MEEAINNYKQLSETAFTSTSKEDTAKFDHRELENQIKKAITFSRLNLDEDAPLGDLRKKACKAFVVATSLRAGGAAVRMRSYNSSTSFAFPDSI